jgi:hypothetical protein
VTVEVDVKLTQDMCDLEQVTLLLWVLSSTSWSHEGFEWDDFQISLSLYNFEIIPSWVSEKYLEIFVFVVKHILFLDYNFCFYYGIYQNFLCIRIILVVAYPLACQTVNLWKARTLPIPSFIPFSHSTL